MDLRPDSSPERGSFSTTLKRPSLRRRSVDPSPASGAVSSDESRAAHGGLRNSLQKLKSNGSTTDLPERRSSNDSSRSPRRLSKLVPSKSRSKRLKKKLSPSRRNEATGLALNPDTAASLQPLDPLDPDSANRSAESLGAEIKSGASSLLTSDSDVEETPSRPPLNSRPSHSGYLTLSSPLITAETLDTSELTENKSSAPPPETESDSRESPAAKVSSASLPSPPPAALGRVHHTPTKALDPLGLPTTKTQDSIKKDTSFRIPGSGTSSGGDEEAGVKKKHESSPSIVTTSIKRSGTQSTSSTDTPSTVITPPSPEFQTNSSTRRDSVSKLFQSIPGANTSTSQTPPSTSHFSTAKIDSYQHRRSKSASTASQKLPSSNVIPLTPALEEVKTPGGSLTQPNASPGFFSSVFSATQNAVNQLSSSFNPSTSNSRARSTTSSTDTEGEKRGPAGGEEVILPNADIGENSAGIAQDYVEEAEPAIATMGSGNLSLSQLGIADAGPEPTTATAAASSSEELSKGVGLAIHQDGQFRRPSEEASAAAAVSAAYSDKPSVVSEKITPSLSSSDIPAGRPRSIESGTETISPPRSLVNGLDSGVPARRSDSVRSRISDKRKGRRNSSMNTGSTIAAAIGASHATIGNPAAGRPLPQRPTGFAVASSRRNKDFHQLFKSVPEDDYLIEDYSAALQRDILLHGRLYVSEKHICFSSNILGWVTNLVINFDEVVSMEKKSTAVIFPNAIVIQTLHTKSVFASFISRDSTYDLLIAIWRIGHPNLKVTENGHSLDNNSGGVDRTEATESIDEEDSGGSASESDEDEEDGLDEGDDDSTHNGAIDSTGRGGTVGDLGGETPRVLSTSKANTLPAGQIFPAPAGANGVGEDSLVDGSSATAGGPLSGVDFPGPATHPPTECLDQDTHYDKSVQDTAIPAPLGKVYAIMFGPASGIMMRKFLIEDQKCTDVQLEDDKKGMGDEVKTFSYSFIKPLNASIGPKQTKCLVSQSLETFDLEKAVSVTCSTQTPDVPSGNVFTTKTKYCLTWAAGNATRLVMNSTVEWSGKSWLKGPIEKGASEGQVQYGKDLAAFLKSQLITKSATKGPKGKIKGKKRKANGSPTGTENTVARKSAETDSQAGRSSWGLLEPLQGVLSPVGDILGPLLSLQTFLGLSLLLMTTLYFRQSYVVVPRDGLTGSGLPGGKTGGQGRFATYEQLWQHEENELWKWLEDRINLDPALNPLAGDPPLGQRNNEKFVSNHGKDTEMTNRQIDDAIRVTEDRLAVLKESLEEKKKSFEGA